MKFLKLNFALIQIGFILFLQDEMIEIKDETSVLIPDTNADELVSHEHLDDQSPDHDLDYEIVQEEEKEIHIIKKENGKKKLKSEKLPIKKVEIKDNCSV